MAMFLPTGPDWVFLAADKASIESYLHPIQDSAGPVIPVGDLGSFILAVGSADSERQRRGRDEGEDEEAADEPDGFNGILRVLGSVLFDDLWASLFRHAFRLSDLARMAEIHPRQVYVGPTVPMERDGWRKSGTWSLTVLKSFEKWQKQ